MASQREDDNDVMVVELVRDLETGFGFSICGGQAPPGHPLLPIVVSKIREGTPAHQSKLRVGHKLLEIDGTSLVGLTHDQAVIAIRKSTTKMKLKVSEARVDWKIAGSKQDGYLPQRQNLARVLAPHALETVKALHPFKPRNPDELELKRNDLIEVYGRGQDGWCVGKLVSTGQQGYFPGNFVMKVRAAPTNEAIYAEIDRGEDLYEELPDEQTNTPFASPLEQSVNDLSSNSEPKTSEKVDDTHVQLNNGDVYAVPTSKSESNSDDPYQIAVRDDIPDYGGVADADGMPVYATVTKSSRPSQQIPSSRPLAVSPMNAGEFDLYASIDDFNKEEHPKLPERRNEGPSPKELIPDSSSGDAVSVGYKSTSDLGMVDEVYEMLPPPLQPRAYRKESRDQLDLPPPINQMLTPEETTEQVSSPDPPPKKHSIQKQLSTSELKKLKKEREKEEKRREKEEKKRLKQEKKAEKARQKQLRKESRFSLK